MNEVQPLAIAKWPPPGSVVSVRSWLREIAALGRVSIAPPPFPDDAARGRGQPVIVVPGFCAPDLSTGRLREFLKRQGFAPQPWNCGPNLGPTRNVLLNFERQLSDAVVRNGAPVSLVGVSLGGTIAREVAKRRPDCVARIVTLLSPIKLPVATPLAPLAQVAALFWDGDAKSALARVAEPPPVPLTAIVNPNDGVVDWRCCVPDHARQVETIMIAGEHMTIGSNPEAQRVVAARLATA